MTPALLLLATSGLAQTSSRCGASQVQIQALGEAVELFKLEYGRYPTETEGLSSLTETDPPFITTLPSDPWGNPYIYRMAGPGFTILSAGADGQTATGDDITSAGALGSCPRHTPLDWVLLGILALAACGMVGALVWGTGRLVKRLLKSRLI